MSKSMNHIAAIHTLKAKLHLSDDDYRALLRHLTGKTSSKDCTQGERARVREHMQKLSLRMGVSPQQRTDQTPGYVRAARPLERKVWALWGALGRAGKLESPTPQALLAFVKRQTGCDHVRWCDDWQLNGLVEALKLWERRPPLPSAPNAERS